MKMQISLVLAKVLIHAVIAISGTLAEKAQAKKCFYRDSVNLMNIEPNEDGSYLYNDILIPKEKVFEFDLKMEFLNTIIKVAPHPRGCVCGKAGNNYCVKLCCERGEFFNDVSYRCEKIRDNFIMPTNLTVLMKNDYVEEVNIFQHFVPQVGLPCAKPSTLLEADDAWILLENGSLYIYAYDTQLDTVSYCITPHRLYGSGKGILMAMSCPLKHETTFPLWLNTYAMAISVIFLIPTILVYLVIKELRSNLGGTLFICYLISMTSAYTVLSYINVSQMTFALIKCSIMGFIGYFFYISSFMWLSVLSFHMLSYLKATNVSFNVHHNKTRFAIYNLYAWGSAGLLTSSVVWAQMSDGVPELYKPGIGVDVCWVDTRKWAAALYFYWLNLIILAFNIITFITITVRIYVVHRDVAKITNRDSFSQEYAGVLLRLFSIMGISNFIMDIASYCARNYRQYDSLFILTDLCNAIQGVLIFKLFILKPKVIALIKAKFQPPKPHRPRLDATSRETNLSRLTSSTAATGSPTISVSP